MDRIFVDHRPTDPFAGADASNNKRNGECGRENAEPCPNVTDAPACREEAGRMGKGDHKDDGDKEVGDGQPDLTVADVRRCLHLQTDRHRHRGNSHPYRKRLRGTKQPAPFIF